MVQCMIQLFLGLRNRVCTIRESQGKKCPFHLGQGKSGNVRETCNGQGKIALLLCRSGKKSHFLSSHKFLIYFVYIGGVSFYKFYVYLCNLINPKKI